MYVDRVVLNFEFKAAMRIPLKWKKTYIRDVDLVLEVFWLNLKQVAFSRHA